MPDQPDSANEEGKADSTGSKADSDLSRRAFLKKLAYVPPLIETVYLLSDTGTAYAASPIGNEPPPPPPPPPTVNSCSPNTGVKGNSLTVTVSGTDFVSGATADFGSGITVDSVTFFSSTTLSVDITISIGATTGSRNVTITNPDLQSGTLVAGFTVTATPAPTVTLCTPSSAPRGTTLNVTITGTNFVSGATVSFNDTKITVNTVTFLGATSLLVNISIANGAARTAKNVTVTNPDLQSGTKIGGFTVT